MFVRAMESILLAGAGITGSVAAYLIGRMVPDRCRLTVWEKTGEIGGRFITKTCPNNPKCMVDLGAQYISAEPQDLIKNMSLYDELLKNGLLKVLEGHIEGDKVWPQDTQHFVSPQGMSSIVKYFLEKSEAEIKLRYPVEEIQQEGDHYVVKSSDGISEMFDSVILTMSVSDLLQIKGIIPQIIDSQLSIREKLQAVEYSSRFAVGLYYKPGTRIEVPWVAKYFRDDPVVVFIAVDNKKRGQKGEEVGPSLLVHTSVPFTLQYMKQDVDRVTAEYILPRLHTLLPNLPKEVSIKSHLWQVSQVYKGYEGKPGILVLQASPLLVCGGDAFTESKFGRCLDSATALCKSVSERIL